MDERWVLSSEFAAVAVEPIPSTGGLVLQILDLGTGATARLDPVEALRRVGRVGTETDPLGEVIVSVDRAGNGPRLRVAHAGHGSAIYLDPLELADAAATGAWGELPPAYAESLGTAGHDG